ncbi:hypothetical protein [Mammaliicoccus sciuri]|uniref:hypothetical protein n=1 Tax=Mammaliicoccus sciuri TaxID=1296 RepID=UPI0021CE1E05|nr:hypothetical protein [Mammaliicoccus sciuri]UXU70166.1 hypothetical protein MUA36_05655 [Mammaliicoccus sciuri]
MNKQELMELIRDTFDKGDNVLVDVTMEEEEILKQLDKEEFIKITDIKIELGNPNSIVAFLAGDRYSR